MAFNLDSILSSTTKSKYRSSELIPIKLCMKYSPASIALYYKVESDKNSKFLHKIEVQKDINQGLSAEEIYNKLLKHEHAYWNPKVIAKNQIMKIIELLIDKDDTDSTPLESYVKNNAENIKKPNIDKKLFAGDANIESIKLDSPKQSVLPFDNQESDLFQENEVVEKDKSKEVTKTDSEEFTEDKLAYLNTLKKVFIKELGCEAVLDAADNLYSLNGSFIGKADLDEENLASQNKQSDKCNKEEPVDIIEDISRLKSFQRVYLEDLGEEVLMDPDGKFVGKAEETNEDIL